MINMTHTFQAGAALVYADTFIQSVYSIEGVNFSFFMTLYSFSPSLASSIQISSSTCASS